MIYTPARTTPDYDPDLRGPAVIVRGEIVGGFHLTGPFETIDAAVKWWRAGIPRLEVNCSIVLVEAPK